MLSLCMIVRDEAEVLARCLDSVKEYAEQIVIVDTGSTDGTPQIAQQYGAKLLFTQWEDDFSKARNLSFSAAEEDYILWLDADDALSPQDGEKLRLLKERLEKTPADMVMCPYQTSSVVFYRERVLRRAAQFVWKGRVHECIPPRGTVAYADMTVRHLGSNKDRGTRNLRIYRRWAQEEPLFGRDLFYYGRELMYHKFYREAAEKLEEMLAGEGWYVNKIEACKTLSECYLAMGRRDDALRALFGSFLYGEPRASVLCAAADVFFSERRYRDAALWYEAALSCRDHSAEGDFESPNCRGLFPVLQLVVCYDRLGDREKALFYHKKTEEIAPANPSVLFNRQYFGL